MYTKKEFDEYTRGRDLVAAIGLRNVNLLDEEICLETMRRYEKNFQPPQFFQGFILIVRYIQFFINNAWPRLCIL